MYSMDHEIVADYIIAMGAPMCDCGLEAPLRTSWTEVNPGRRFYGCANYGRRNWRCNFFIWVDSEFTERSKNIINAMLRKTDRLEKEIAEMKRKENKKMCIKIFAWGISLVCLGIPLLASLLGKEKK